MLTNWPPKCMGISKVSEFSKRINQMAGLCHALGHPARIAILELLLLKKKLIAVEISSQLPLANATISQHLKVLVHLGILNYQVEGSFGYYSVRLESLKILEGNIKLLQQRYRSWAIRWILPFNFFIEKRVYYSL